MADYTDSDAIDPSAQTSSSNPMADAARYNAQMAGVLNGLSASAFNPQQREQLAANSAALMQKATNNLVGSEKPLRKLSHVLGNVLSNAGMAVAGASSGQGFEAVRNMMADARRNHKAQEAQTVQQLKAAHQAAQMGSDPKMISNILNGYKNASKNAINMVDQENKAAKNKIYADNATKRNAIQERLAGVREGQLKVNEQRADANDMNALTNQQYKQGMLPVQQQRANTYQQFANAASANAGTNADYKTGMLGVQQQNANTNQNRQASQAVHYGNVDANNANQQGLDQIIKPHNSALAALKPVLTNFEKLAMKRELTPEEDAQYQQIQQTYESIANDAYGQMQNYSPAGIQAQPQPVGMSAGPAGSLNTPPQPQVQPQQAAPQAQPKPQQQPHFQMAVQNLAQRARLLYQQSGGRMTVQQALMAAKQQMGQ